MGDDRSGIRGKFSHLSETEKIEEIFKDVKDLLGRTKIMNKRQDYMEQMFALVLLAYSIVLMIGETTRDKMFGPAPAEG